MYRFSMNFNHRFLCLNNFEEIGDFLFRSPENEAKCYLTKTINYLHNDLFCKYVNHKLQSLGSFAQFEFNTLNPLSRET